MRIPALALFERSLRLESRSRMVMVARTGLLGLILFMLLPLQSMAQAGFGGAPGLRFLSYMVWMNLVFVTLAGTSYFASAITEEKEELMLGLLRMTDLSPVAILLGKSTSRLVGALLLLLVQVPFILLAVTLGGVGLLQIVAAYGTLLAYLFFVCNLALVFSVVFRNTAIAAGFMLAALLSFLFLHYWAASLVQDAIGPLTSPVKFPPGFMGTLAWMIDLWRQATPTERVGEIFQTGFMGGALGFQVASNLLLGVLLFFLAWLLFEPCNREERESAPRRWIFRGTATRRSQIPPGLVGPRAISWKDFAISSGGRSGLLMKFGVIAALLVIINLITLKYGSANDLTQEFEGGALIWISIIVTAIFLALDAARVFQEEVRWKTLSALVMLPVSVPELAYRKVFGALLNTLPLLAGAVVGAVMVLADIVKMFADMGSGEFGVFVVLILQYVMFLHLVAFLSLLVKRGALPLAIGIQYLGGSFFMGFLGMIFTIGGGGRVGPEATLWVAGIICVVATIILHYHIGRRLSRAAAED